MKFSFKKTWTVTLTLLALTFSAVGVTPAHAASLTVNTLEDNITNGDGLCTLREAITAANNNANFNDCTGAGYGADTITFNVNGTILLVGSQLPTITVAGDALTIDGTGQTVTISGNNSVRVMQVDADASLTLNNLTIANGIATGNSGGGINNVGTLTITNSTFSGNNANGGNGGGINNNGTLTITNSTFSGNSANSGIGAGVYASGGTVTITNSTFSGNSTPNGSGAGISNNTGVGVILHNTILANNASGGNCYGAITDGGNNIDDGVTCGWGSASGSKSSANPLLGALADNGGPTQTFALLTGSPAIDGVTFNGSNSAPSTDQRGVPRPQGPRYDIGAFELDNITITRADSNPTGAATVHFTVTFSEAVSGVDTADFTLTKTGPISGASVTVVTGGPTAYNVAVDTGTGVGTIRLDVPTGATVTDLTGNPLAGLPYTSGETYDVRFSSVYLPLAFR
jgi:CSLREA domain-containing protein